MPWLPATRRCDGFCMVELAPRRELPTRKFSLFCWVIASLYAFLFSSALVVALSSVVEPLWS